MTRTKPCRSVSTTDKACRYRGIICDVAADVQSGSSGLTANGGWNVYGDHGVAFMNDSGSGAKITRHHLASGTAAGDTLLGTSVQLAGLLYMDSPNTPPRV